MAEEKRNSVKNELLKTDRIAITCDCWTSVKQKMGFLGATAHYFDGFTLKSVSLG